MSERTIDEPEMSKPAVVRDAAKTLPSSEALERPQMLNLLGSDGVDGTCSDGSCSV